MSPKKKTTIYHITLVKSPIGYSQRQKGTIRALGLRQIRQTVMHPDSPALQGMLAKVSHLVEVKKEVGS